MAFRRNRRSKGPGPNPGLTPIDDIHGSSSTTSAFEPDHTTGRLPAQDDSESGATRKRERISKKTSRKR